MKRFFDIDYELIAFSDKFYESDESDDSIEERDINAHRDFIILFNF